MAAPYNLAWLNLRHSEHVIAQLTLTGKRFTGTELHRLGIAYDAPPTSETVNVAMALCEELSSYPNDALINIKRMMRAYHEVPADEWFDTATRNAPPRRGEIPRVS